MKPEFITYQKFNDVALANALAEQLEAHGVAYRVEEESLTFNPSFALNDQLSKEYAIKIKSEDFEKVTKLLAEDETGNTENVDKNYYLFTFTDDELMEVITKADEWSAFDFVLARKILAEKGVMVKEEDVAKAKSERIEELKAPDVPQTGWIIIGYLFAFLGGILGLFIGWHLSTYKKTLPDGERVYEYSEHDKRQGRIIFYISIVMTMIWLILRLIPIFRNNY